jgi:hypothetical protein
MGRPLRRGPVGGLPCPANFPADEKNQKILKLSDGRIEKPADSEIESSDCKTVQHG